LVQRDNPSIHAVINDGTRIYDHATDGRETEIGSCQANFRNMDANRKSRVKITYEKSKLTVKYDIDGNHNEDNWKQCFEAAVSLPTGYYFGVSAATGGLFDKHDLYSFITYGIGPDPEWTYQDRNQQQQQQVQETQPTQQVAQQQAQQTGTLTDELEVPFVLHAFRVIIE